MRTLHRPPGGHLGRIAGVALLGTGCAQILGTDEYEVADSVVAALPSEEIPGLLELPGCAECIASSCPVERSDCTNDSDCQQVIACADNCSDPVCMSECSRHLSHSFAQPPALEELSRCADGQCREECQLGARWECVDRWTAPVPVSDSVDLSWMPIDFSTSEPIGEGIAVDICKLIDLDCKSPEPGGVTDAEGVVPLTFPVVSGAGSERNVLDSYLSLTDAQTNDPIEPRIPPTLVRFGAMPSASSPPNKQGWSTWSVYTTETWNDLDAIRRSATPAVPDVIPGTGRVLVVVFPCVWLGPMRGRDVQIGVLGESDFETVYWGPRTNRFDLGQATSNLGGAFLYNVPVGLKEFTAHDAEGRALGSQFAPVRADHTTSLVIFPAQRR